jgi:uncharacterized protein (DUF362 family)
VGECLKLAGLDARCFGSKIWNPLGELIRPGQTVLLKPNLVQEDHPTDPEGWKYVITHGSFISSVAYYVVRALEGRGRILIADAPQTDSSFAKICQRLSLHEIATHYRRRALEFEILDLRKEEWENVDEVIVARRAISGDPAGYACFDLADMSEFKGHNGSGRYYGADYDASEVNRHHSNGHHEYLISKSVIQADVIISLPKLKTHKKAGITASLKNAIGLNGDKNWLPHHTEAGNADPGDERPVRTRKQRVERASARVLRGLSLRSPGAGTWLHRRARSLGKRVFGDTEQVIRSGNWWGNDTIWRTCLDLNKILLYGLPDGSICSDRLDERRAHLVFLDAIISGEGAGPMRPDPVHTRFVAFGMNPAAVDAAGAWLMGFDPDRIPIIRQAFLCSHYAIAEGTWRDVQAVSTKPLWNGRLESIPPEACFRFKPALGWKDYVERRPEHACEDLLRQNVNA